MDFLDLVLWIVQCATSEAALEKMDLKLEHEGIWAENIQENAYEAITVVSKLLCLWCKHQYFPGAPSLDH